MQSTAMQATVNTARPARAATRRRSLALASTLLLGLATSIAGAQGFPNKLVKIVVPWIWLKFAR